MRWLVDSNGQISGPMSEAMLAALAKTGEISPDAMVREESDVAWEPIAQTRFAPVAVTSPAATSTAAKPGTVGAVPALSVVLAGVFAVYLYATCGDSHSSDSGPPPLPTVAAAPAAVDAWVMAQEFVKKKLKAPGTADFGHVLDGSLQRSEDCCKAVGDGSWTCRGWVDAQNEFGAKLRADFTITLKPDGPDHWLATRGPTLTER